MHNIHRWRTDKLRNEKIDRIIINLRRCIKLLKHTFFKNGDAMRGFLKAVSKGVSFLYDPANRAEAARILVGETKMEEANALRTWDYYTKELKPFDASLDLPDRQIELLIGVLVEMGDFRAGEDYRPSRFVDASFLPK